MVDTTGIMSWLPEAQDLGDLDAWADVPLFKTLSSAVVRDVLYGHREETFRYDLLDMRGNLVGNLDGAQTGGSLEFNVYNEVRGSGSLVTVLYDANYKAKHYPDKIDWLNRMVRISYVTPDYQVPLITAIPQAPTEAHTDEVVTMEVELYDRTIMLQEDSYGRPFSRAAGSNIKASVVEVMSSIGVTDLYYGGSSTANLKKAMNWKADATKYQIVNDLLRVAGCFHIYTDAKGRFRADKYVSPEDRPKDWTFDFGASGLYLPEFKWTIDRYHVPNKYIVVADEITVEATKHKKKYKYTPIGIATDNDPKSPFSYQSRSNRYITVRDSDIELAEKDTQKQHQATVAKAAKDRLREAQLVGVKVEELVHPWLPFGVNSLVEFKNKRTSPLLAVCQAQTITLQAGGLCTSTLRGLTKADYDSSWEGDEDQGDENS